MAKGKSARRGASRIARTMRSLLVIGGIGGVLAVYNIVGNRRDVGLATGPAGPDQQAFFRAAAARPDVELFYKGLSPDQRITMARRIGEYDDGGLAPLIGKLLGTFDPEARKALTTSLTSLAKRQPDAVAAQLGLAGSFQQLAVSTALKSIGPPALPLVAKRVEEAGPRPNAVAYLVDFGADSVPPLTALLEKEAPDVRLAAADALGKLGAKSAVPRLIELYAKAEGAERMGYLSALAGIGDPRSEEILRAALNDETLTMPQRAQVAIGLGRVGRPSAVAALVPFAADPDGAFRESVLSALALTGDAALSTPALPLATRLEIAAAVDTPGAEALVAASLDDPALGLQALTAAARRPGLVPRLVAVARETTDGDRADLALRALATTDPGRQALTTLTTDPTLGGLAARRLALGG